MNEINDHRDIIIIGGGLSGLHAANLIKSRDDKLSLMVLEGKDRVGGRTLGQELKCANGTEYWDLGGQWIGRCQPHIMALLKELDVGVYQQYIDGTKVMQLGSNRVSTYQSDIPSLPFYCLIELHFLMRKIEKMRKKIPIHDPSKCKHAAEWDSMTMDQALRQWCWFKATRHTIESACRCMFGVELRDMSLFYYLMYVQSANGLEPLISAKINMGQEYRISGGAFSICDKLVDKIGKDNIQLSEPVVHIRQDDKLVHITTLGGRNYSCERAILALPPHQAVKIEYSPVLPLEKFHVLQRMPVGYLTKVIVTYTNAFWRAKGYSGEAVTNGGPGVVGNCNTGPLNIVYDATSEKGSPALVSFIGGAQQIEYSKLMPRERQDAVIASLAEMFGPEAQDFLDYAEKNWNEEPYNGGCPVSVATPGVVSYIAPGLRHPYYRLHFAGTESATVWCGFLNGAVQSGRRAALEVLYNMRPDKVSHEDVEETYYNMRERNSDVIPRKGPYDFRMYRYIVPGAVICVGLVVFTRKLSLAYFDPK